MKLVIIDKNNKARLNKILEWFIYMAGYTISFILISLLFGTFQINDEHLILYSFFAVVMVYILNKTIKPVILKLTMPLMGITVGLFYFVINAGILKLVDIIMGDKLNFTSAWKLFFIAVFLAATNAIIEELIIKPIIRRFKKK
ncbi:MAG: phage holin family protein [Bacilli bacterium]|nr:phage holin family protein [Bacilli bacterium]